MRKQKLVNLNLVEIIKNVWNSMPVSTVAKLVDSMPRRIKAVQEAKGGPTRY